MSYTCYLSLGANLGDRAGALRAALSHIAHIERTRLTRVSSFYATPPWGKTDQPGFLNAAAAVDTELAPLDLLHATQRLETMLGRVRHEHWGARTIDIDLVYAGAITHATDELRLPHPYLTQRAFVLVPLAEIAPGLIIEDHSIDDWLGVPAVARDSADITRTTEPPAPAPLALIACTDAAGGIGRAGGLLFHLPGDMAFFRQKTTGGIVIMGRRTAASLPSGRPLPARTNVVLSTTFPERPGFTCCRTLGELWAALHTLRRPGQELWCIGGGATYGALLPYTSEAWITRVNTLSPADTYLPPLSGFQLDRVLPPSEASTGPGYQFYHYHREAE